MGSYSFLSVGILKEIKEKNDTVGRLRTPAMRCGKNHCTIYSEKIVSI